MERDRFVFMGYPDDEADSEHETGLTEEGFISLSRQLGGYDIIDISKVEED